MSTRVTLDVHLQDAVTCGWFRAGPDNSGGPNLPVVAATISEIALGMEFLHSQGIVHGDLSSGASHSHNANFCHATIHRDTGSHATRDHQQCNALPVGPSRMCTCIILVL